MSKSCFVKLTARFFKETVRYYVVILLIISSFSAFGQIKFSCGFSKQTPDSLCNLVSTENKFVSSKAFNQVKSIVDQIGLPQNFVLIQCSKIENAFAVTSELGIRYIVIDKDWISSSSNHWLVLGVLAHEIGHHLCGHTINKSVSSFTERQSMELEADRFAGFVLKRLGASKEQALIAINTIVPTEQINKNSTHPSKSKRVGAILSGFEQNMLNDLISKESIVGTTSFEEYFNIAYSAAPEPSPESNVDSLYKAAMNYIMAAKNPLFLEAYVNYAAIAIVLSEKISDQNKLRHFFDLSIDFLRAVDFDMLENHFGNVDLAKLYNNVGHLCSTKAYKFGGGDYYSAAISYLEKATKLDPNNGSAHLNLGIAVGNYGFDLGIPTLDLTCPHFLKACRLGVTNGCRHYNNMCR